MKSVTGRRLIAVYFLKLFKSSCKPDMASRDWTAWLLDWPEPGQFLGSNQRVGHSRLEGQCPTLAIGIGGCRQVPMANSTVKCCEWGTGNLPETAPHSNH